MIKALAARKARLALTVRRGANLGTTTTALLNPLILLADLLDTGSTRSRDIGSIPVVGVDTNKLGNTLSLNILDNDIARPAVVRAISATAVQLSSVDNSEILDCHCTAAVMLNDLVFGFLRTTAVDKDVTGA